MVKENEHDFDKLFKEAKWDENFEIPWSDIFYLFKKMPVEKDFDLKWGRINKEKLHELLVEEHDFSEDRFESTINKLMKEDSKKSQKGLGEWFG